MAIHLGCPLPDTSSDLTRRHWERATPSPSYLILLRMGFTRPASRPAAGALLPHHFTLTGAPLGGHRLIRPRADSGGVFSVALSLGSPPLAVSEHPALWSSDFPQPRPMRDCDHPTCSEGNYSRRFSIFATCVSTKWWDFWSDWPKFAKKACAMLEYGILY